MNDFPSASTHLGNPGGSRNVEGSCPGSPGRRPEASRRRSGASHGNRRRSRAAYCAGPAPANASEEAPDAGAGVASIRAATDLAAPGARSPTTRGIAAGERVAVGFVFAAAVGAGTATFSRFTTVSFVLVPARARFFAAP